MLITQPSHFLILLGGLFLTTLIVSPLAEKFHIPRVSLFILSGIVIGQVNADILNGHAQEWFAGISNFTLLIIGYLLGTKLTKEYLQEYAKQVFKYATFITIGTFIVVALGIWLIGFPIEVALILGAISVATDPAATLDVINQSKIKNNFTNIIEGIVALDDALALVLFSAVLAVLGFFTGVTSALATFEHMIWELVGAICWGAIIGYLLVFLLNKKSQQTSVLVESLGLLFLCGGVSLLVEFSFLLAAMTMGIVVVNKADESQEHLHEIEFVEQPLLVLFFILAGASLDFNISQNILALALFFIGLRIAGRFISGKVITGEQLSPTHKNWLGIALLPQAGIAMGMALLAGQHYPQHQSTILAVAISATMVFELTGPIITNIALSKTR